MLELLISSSFLFVFLHQELSKADSRRLSGLRHHSLSFLQPAGCWLFLLGGFRKKVGHHDLRCLLSKFRFSSIPLKTAKTKLAAEGIILESSLEFMSQMFLKLQPKS
jgi:hypothetical protein